MVSLNSRVKLKHSWFTSCFLFGVKTVNQIFTAYTDTRNRAVQSGVYGHRPLPAGDLAPGCFSSRGKPRAKGTPGGGERGADKPSATAQPPPTSDRFVADWSPVNDESMPTPLVSNGREPLPPDSIGVGAQKEVY
eukprot:1252823-Pleurochrysis_carterae.AAC.2